MVGGILLAMLFLTMAELLGYLIPRMFSTVDIGMLVLTLELTRQHDEGTIVGLLRL